MLPGVSQQVSINQPICQSTRPLLRFYGRFAARLRKDTMLRVTSSVTVWYGDSAVGANCPGVNLVGSNRTRRKFLENGVFTSGHFILFWDWIRSWAASIGYSRWSVSLTSFPQMLSNALQHFGDSKTENLERVFVLPTISMSTWSFLLAPKCYEQHEEGSLEQRVLDRFIPK